MSILSDMTTALNQGVLDAFGEESVVIRQGLVFTTVSAVFVDSDGGPDGVRFEIRESDLANLPAGGDTITRATGDQFRVQRTIRLDGDWLQLFVRATGA